MEKGNLPGGQNAESICLLTLSGRRGGLRYRLTLTQGWVLSMRSGVKEVEGRRLEEW